MDLRFYHLFVFQCIPLAETLPPLVVLFVFKQGHNGRKRFLAIAQHGHVDGHVFVNFCRVYVEMNFLGLPRITIQFARDTVIKAHAHGYQQIALLGFLVGAERTVHTEHADIQRVVGRQGRESQQGTAGRQSGLLDKAFQFFLSVAELHPLSHQHQGALGGIDQGSGFHHALLGGVGHRYITADKIYTSGHIFRFLQLGVFGKIEHHGSRTTAARNIKGTVYSPSHIFCRSDLVSPFADGLCYVHHVAFLKGIRAQHLRSHLSGNHHHGRAVHHGIGDTRDGVGCPRAARHQTNASPSAHTGIAFGSMGCGLLVAHEDMVKSVAVII